MFRRRHMHSSECCHYRGYFILLVCPFDESTSPNGPLMGVWRFPMLVVSHTEKTGELPMGCTWATELAAHGNFAMQIRLPTTSVYGNSGQLSGQPTTSKYEKSGQLSGQWSGLTMGILPFKLGYPLHVLPYMETVGSSVGNGVGCPWELWHANRAAHYFLIWI